MKLLIALMLTLGFAHSVYAETCTSELRNRNHLIIDTFNGWGYSINEACQDSRRQCHEELNWRARSGNYPGAYCKDRLSGPYDPTPSQFRCFANLKRGNGAHIASFRGLSTYSTQQACTQALRECNRDLSARQRRGQNSRAYCEIDRGTSRPPHDPGRDIVTRSCSAELIGPRGQIHRILTARAQGPRYDRDIQRVACERAMKMCQSVRTAREYCRIN